MPSGKVHLDACPIDSSYALLSYLNARESVIAPGNHKSILQVEQEYTRERRKRIIKLVVVEDMQYWEVEAGRLVY